MLIALLIFVVHWYAVILVQSFFHHRVSSHRQFILSYRSVQILTLISVIVSGPSYLSNYIYAILHRLHHRYADTEKDPHSPKNFKTLMGMMRATAEEYGNIRDGTNKLESDQWVFDDPIPRWKIVDDLAGTAVMRVLWAIVYIVVYHATGAPWWFWMPLCLGSIVMNPLHGALVNWYSHKIGTRPYDLGEVTATNLVGKWVDFILCGEFYHNHHHRNQDKINFADKDKDEKGFDIVYWIIVRPLLYLKVIKLRKPAAA